MGREIDDRSGRHARVPSGRVPTTATAGENERKPAATVERLLTVLSVVERTLPQRDVHPGMRALRGRRAADGPRHAIRLLDMARPAGGAIVVLNQQPAPVESGATT